jgi:cell division protein FtsB
MIKFVLIGLTSFLQYQLWFAPDGVQGVLSAKQRVDIQNQKLIKLTQKNEKLLQEVSSLKNEEEIIEESARSQLGMIKKGEAFYQVVDVYENSN